MPTFNPEPEGNFTQKKFDAFPEGAYDFEVFSATEKKSKQGNEMIEVVLKVFNGAKDQRVWDYHTFTTKGQWKPYSFCKAVGIIDKFKAGDISPYDYANKSGRVFLKVEKEEGVEGSFRNVVGHYIELVNPLFGKEVHGESNIPFNPCNSGFQS